MGLLNLFLPDDYFDGAEDAAKINSNFEASTHLKYEDADTVCLLVHGINVTDAGAGTSAKFMEPLADAAIWPRTIGYNWVLIPRDTNKRVAKQLAEEISFYKADGKKVVVIGHSNGCAIMDYASRKYNSHADVYVYLNPAIRSDRAPRDVGLFMVWYTDTDSVVWWAKASNILTFGLVKPRPWGEMGRIGYTGDRQNYVGFEYSNKNHFSNPGSGHSGIFAKFDYFSPLVISSIQKAISLDIATDSPKRELISAVAAIGDSVYDDSSPRNLKTQEPYEYS